MFPKYQRITKNKEFELIFKTGKSSYANYLGLKSLNNNLPYFRAAVLVSKKVSKRANKRNLLKRKLREIIKSYSDILKGKDLVVLVMPAANGKSYQELLTDFTQAISKLKK